MSRPFLHTLPLASPRATPNLNGPTNFKFRALPSPRARSPRTTDAGNPLSQSGDIPPRYPYNRSSHHTGSGRSCTIAAASG